MKDKIIEILHSRDKELLSYRYRHELYSEIAEELMELLQTEGWVKMRSKSQARRMRLQLEEKPGPFKYPIIEVGDNSLVTEEEE